ncbi:methyltransferase domain-containing protein [Geoalkalibacter ferrihydriticus DSM 17813]|uniref:Methyltransferase domain-containing protein n=2 Tax=Geoalkalibacter ferrihydriticus TaxID=392333 RepID=A0A0C2HWU5_9BACT|nr:methyltransferase [Geoalkalibacter ferrihydriticus]KIH77252.1 methyltransferase domain-containing protein [Geoalkalibacter ferrihydriticus DSM 17813]
MNRSSRNRLTPRMLDCFSGSTLFDHVARVCCRAGCLPRKELYEAWEVARRVRRRMRGGRVVDLACGHGLLAYLMLLLDAGSSQALAVDRRLPASAAKLAREFDEEWPRLAERVQFLECDINAVNLGAGDLVVSAHACGNLSDLIVERVLAARARLALLPCCHDLKGADLGGLQGWLDGPLALDVLRAERLRSAGYRVHTQTIPGEITPKNRLLLAEPI